MPKSGNQYLHFKKSRIATDEASSNYSKSFISTMMLENFDSVYESLSQRGTLYGQGLTMIENKMLATKITSRSQNVEPLTHPAFLLSGGLMTDKLRFSKRSH